MVITWADLVKRKTDHNNLARQMWQDNTVDSLKKIVE